VALFLLPGTIIDLLDADILGFALGAVWVAFVAAYVGYEELLRRAKTAHTATHPLN
jgi:hypothetical protein